MDNLKQEIRNCILPIVDTLVDKLYEELKAINGILPSSATDDQRAQLMKEMTSSAVESFTTSIKHIDIDAAANKLKEAMNGRK